MNEETMVLNEAVVAEDVEAAPVKKDNSPSKKELIKANEELKAENNHLNDTINQMNTYIDKLYANSNVMVNKIEGTAVQLTSLRKLTGMLGDVLNLVNERINAIEIFIKKGE